MLTLNELHIELTNRCTLECPACPRTTWKNILKRPVEKHDLDIDLFEKFIDSKAIKNIERFVLCGDYGDSIYYPKLIEFIQRFRYKKFSIMTNGSYQTEKFWNELSKVLTEDDIIVFGIDGLEDTNHLYRKNANWSSIMMALDIMLTSRAKVKWQTIVFSFNYNRLEEIKQFAESKGAEFFALKTHRFGDDSLIPPDEMVETNYLFREEFLSNMYVEIDAQCETERVITSSGHFLPCDWIRNPQTFYKSDLWKNKEEWFDKLSIDKINLDQGIDLVSKWKQLVIQKGLEGSTRLDTLCKMRCRKGCGQSNIVEFHG